MLQTENPQIGYNKTFYRHSLEKKYNEKIAFDNRECMDSSDITENSNIFEIYNKSYDMAIYLINQWIFNEIHRDIVKDRLLNGYTFDRLSEKYHKSVAQIKRIVYDSQKKLEKHM